MVGEQVTKAAGGFIDAMKGSPVALALVAVIFAMMALLFYQSKLFSEQRADNVKLFVQMNSEVQKLMNEVHRPAAMTELKSWFKENQTLVMFLIVQAIALGAAGAGMIAYYVKMETRVSIMETRGAEYTVARMEEMKMRITVLEQAIRRNEASIERIIDIMTRELKK